MYITRYSRVAKDIQKPQQANDSFGYGYLRSYLEQLKNLNPGSITKFVSEPSKKNPEKEVFVFGFIMLAVFAKASISSKIRVKTIDGGHLFSDEMPYISLIMEAITPNGRRFPLAVALCDGENHVYWKAFLEAVGEFVYFNDCENIDIVMHKVLNNDQEILLGDRDKGLGSASEEVLPHMLKRKCVKHIERNLLENAAISVNYNVKDAEVLNKSTSSEVSKTKPHNNTKASSKKVFNI